MPKYRITYKRGPLMEDEGREPPTLVSLITAPDLEAAARAFAFPDEVLLRLHKDVWYFYGDPLVIEELPDAPL